MRWPDQRDPDGRGATEAEVETLRERARTAVADGELDTAIDALGQAALLQPQRADIHLALGSALRQSGRIEAARRAFTHAIGLDEEYRSAHEALLALPPPPPQGTNFAVGQVLDSSRGANKRGLGRYTVVATRRGGFGVVYIVRDDEGSTSAMKTFDARLLWSDDDRERFLREAATWVSLDPHPNVVTARWVEEIQGFPCLIMEYVDGGDLRDRLGSQRPGIHQALTLGLHLCDGMDHASTQLGLVHRDLKPANCMVTRKGMLKVTDFGLARCFQQAEESFLAVADLPGPARALYTTIAGTPAYMPPEQFVLGARLGPWTDIYAFAVLLRQMLTGELPPPGRAAEHIDSSVPARTIPDQLAALIRRCVEPDPTRRPASFAEVREQLAQMYRPITGARAPAAPRPGAVGANTWLDRSIAFRSLGLAENALAAADRGLALRPSRRKVENSKLWQVRGLALVELDRRPEALGSYDRALQLNSREPSLWASKGGALSELDRYQEALECYDRCLKIAPDYATAWRNKASTLSHLERYEESAAAFQRAARLLPHDAELLTNWAILLDRQERFPEALERVDEALRVAPRYARGWHTRGNILAHTARPDDALVCYDRAVQIAPRFALAWATRARTLHRLGRAEDAAASCDHALTLNPNDPYARFVRDELLSG